jgi:hypothetical protein
MAVSNGTHGLRNQFSASATGARELRIKVRFVNSKLVTDNACKDYPVLFTYLQFV